MKWTAKHKNETISGLLRIRCQRSGYRCRGRLPKLRNSIFHIPNSIATAIAVDPNMAVKPLPHLNSLEFTR